MLRAGVQASACLVVLASLASSAAASCPPAPIRAAITIDGALGDWAEVITNAANAARDGEGTLVDCAYAVDRDCAVPASVVDLDLVAWTWDDDSLFLLVQRYGDAANERNVLLFFDTNADGWLTDLEPVVVVAFQGDCDASSVVLDGYSSWDGAGDPLGDAGMSDGWVPRGWIWGTPVTLAAGQGCVVGEHAIEVAVPWSLMGIAPGSPMGFHVSASLSDHLSGVRDNMGGVGGQVGTTAHHAVSIEPPRAVSCDAGGSAEIVHVVLNDGNVPALVQIEAVSDSSLDVTFRRDMDGDGVAETDMGFDAGGDGLMTLPGDTLLPAGDSDGNGILDFGVLAGGERAYLHLERPCPSGGDGLSETLTITVWDPTQACSRDEVIDQLRIGLATIQPDRVVQAPAGDVAWLAHQLDLNAAVPTAVDLSAISTRGWPHVFMSDPDGDGDPEDATLLIDSDASGLPDIVMTPGVPSHCFVRVSVPASAALGSRQVTFVRAAVNGSVHSVVEDRVVVVQPVDLLPSHLLALGDARHGGAGDTVFFAHRLTCQRGGTRTFDIAATTDLGWPAALLLDPDGDGRPFDARPLVEPVVHVPNTGSFPFLVRVDIPPGGTAGDVAHVDVTAIAREEPALAASAADDAVVSIVRVYGDPGHVVNIVRTDPCSEVHALASSLAPASTDYRFAWRDPSGFVVRIQPVGTDASGACADSLALGAGQFGGQFNVSIEGWDGAAWIMLDTAWFAVGDLLAAVIEPPSGPVDVSGSTVSARLILTNDSFDAPLDASLRWVIRSPDGASYLRPDGSFAPWTGVEATGAEAVSLAPRQTAVRLLGIAGVQHPVPGAYRLEAWRDVACAGTVLVAGTVYDAIVDVDGDGLDRATELAAGTSPDDADSDDDGLLDGADGLADSDGDGAIDALDCDSDDDGLLDGTESGVEVAGAGTDPASPCFLADAWPASTTDPDAADSDGGGEPDGSEDVDRDGRVDPGERNPLDGSDDAVSDRDGDAVGDREEARRGTDPDDADSDDDGLVDGLEPDADTDADGAADALDCDADGDGLPDGLEAGVAAPGAGTDPLRGCFEADADPSTTTNPRAADTDGGGVADGTEDADGDGSLDAGEGDPLVASDDAPGCSRTRPAAVTGLRVARSADAARLSWAPSADPCVTHAVLAAGSLPGLAEIATGLPGAAYDDAAALGPTRVRFYRVRADSWLSGEGDMLP